MSFTFWSVSTSALVSALLAYSIVRSRHLLVKPSIWAVIFFHSFIQWPSALNSEKIYGALPRPIEGFFLFQVFTLFALLGALPTFGLVSKRIWFRLRQSKASPAQVDKRSIVVLGLMFVGGMIIYFFHVPLSQTGLASMIKGEDSIEVARAREASLKTQPMYLRYLYAYISTVVAWALGIICAFKVKKYADKREWVNSFGFAMMIAMLVGGTAIYGARGPAAIVLLAILLAFSLQKGVIHKPLKLIAGLVVILVLPAVLTVLRSEGDLSISSIYEAFTSSILSRVFESAMLTGFYHCEYVQLNGYWGIAGIPKLASLVGVEAVNVFNILLVETYRNPDLLTGLMNTSYIFSYYSFFGLWTLPFTLVAIWSLDVGLLVCSKLRDEYLLLSITLMIISSMHLTSVDFTTTMVTFGFVPGLVTMWMLDYGQRGSRKHHGSVKRRSQRRVKRYRK